MTEYFNYGPHMNLGSNHWQPSDPPTLPSEYLDSRPSPSPPSDLGSHWRKISAAITPTSKCSMSGVSESSDDSRISVKNASLRLQNEGIEELCQILPHVEHQLGDWLLEHVEQFVGDQEQDRKHWSGLKKIGKYFGEITGGSIDEIDEKAAEFVRKVLEMRMRMAKKTAIEEFVRKSEGCVEQLEQAVELMHENRRRVRELTKKLHQSPPRSAADRTAQLLRALTTTIRSLQLTDQELGALEHVIQLAGLDAKAKCALLSRNLLSIVSCWPNEGSKCSLSSRSWPSLPHLASQAPPNLYPTSLFDPSTDGSNLSDLDATLRAARVRLAVEGKNGAIECDPWSTASQLSSFNTSGVSSVQSVDSLSLHTIRCETTGSARTALSQESIVRNVPPRSAIDSDSTNTASLDFSTISLGDMIGDAVYTAKNVAGSEANKLLQTVQRSFGSTCTVSETRPSKSPVDNDDDD
ncbi:unnamed protein product [Caenorhabditis sp. 36 PRJEB53466]|nr:unnamed protein product [Caenorhabditis sp. 36 PRJEB53466]